MGSISLEINDSFDLFPDRSGMKERSGKSKKGKRRGKADGLSKQWKNQGVVVRVKFYNLKV